MVVLNTFPGLLLDTAIRTDDGIVSDYCSWTDRSVGADGYLASDNRTGDRGVYTDGCSRPQDGSINYSARTDSYTCSNNTV